MSLLPLKVKKLSDNAVVPSYSKIGDAGLDLTATSEKIVFHSNISYIEYGTDLAIEIPTGFMGLIFPRSSISSNTSLILNNSVAVIDSEFRGEIKLRFKSFLASGAKKYNVGDRIGQLVIMPYPTVDIEVVEELNDTSRGTGSYGSTGR